MDEAQISSRSIADLVKERFSRARLFERYGIDYFCGGNDSLHTTCLSNGLDLNQILEELDCEENQPSVPPTEWSTRTIAQLVDHIQEEHNRFLKRELPRLITVIDGLRKSYGKSRPELPEVREIFRNLTIELGIHVLNDERLLFPLCRSVHNGPRKQHGELKNLIQVMRAGNESAATAMRQLRVLTNDFIFPADVGNNYKFMLQALRGLEADLHLHIHEENNILFQILLSDEFSPHGRNNSAEL
jgi:regulator of cell morphogenesis and NO signaling